MPDHSLVIPGTIDTHCHALHILHKGLDPRPLYRQLHADGLRAVLDVGVTPADLDERRALLADFPWVWFSAGLHPSEVLTTDTRLALAELSSQIEAASIVAIGEIGLDYHWDTGKRADAIELFEAQVALAAVSDLPVIVHNRDADADALAVLKHHRPRGLMHCFSQTPEFCRQCLDLGLMISFAGNITYTRSDAIRVACRLVPPDRLLVETDGPYLSPVPVRGRVNHPGHLAFTLSAVARLRNEDVNRLADQTAANALTLFRRNTRQ